MSILEKWARFLEHTVMLIMQTIEEETERGNKLICYFDNEFLRDKSTIHTLTIFIYFKHE